MSPNEKILEMKKIFDAAIKLAAAKGHDYAGTVDGMENFRIFGWKGIVVRLSDKLQRIVHYAKSGTHKVKAESLENDLMDTINYAALTLIMYRLENASPVGCPADKDTPPAEDSASAVRLDVEAWNQYFARLYGMRVDRPSPYPAGDAFLRSR